MYVYRFLMLHADSSSKLYSGIYFHDKCIRASLSLERVYVNYGVGMAASKRSEITAASLTNNNKKFRQAVWAASLSISGA